MTVLDLVSQKGEGFLGYQMHWILCERQNDERDGGYTLKIKTAAIQQFVDRFRVIKTQFFNRVS